MACYNLPKARLVVALSALLHGAAQGNSTSETGIEEANSILMVFGALMLLLGMALIKILERVRRASSTGRSSKSIDYESELKEGGFKGEFYPDVIDFAAEDFEGGSGWPT